MQEKKLFLNSEMREITEHGDSGFPIQYYVNNLSFSTENHIPAHWHAGIEIAYVVKGKLSVKVGNYLTNLKEGECICINSGTMHGYESENCVMSVVIFSSEFISPIGSDIYAKYIKPLILDGRIPYIVFNGSDWREEVTRRMDLVFSLLQKYGKEGGYGGFPTLEYKNKAVISKCFEMEVQRELSIIWQLIYEHSGELFIGSSTEREHIIQIRMQQMLNFIHENYRKSITLNDIALSSSVSKSEASRCFHSCLGTSPINYLLRYRVKKAMQLLHNESKTVENISYECGFGSSAYFCKVFRQHTGMTPNQYRRK